MTKPVEQHGDVPANPMVSVIVPARNEEACLAACLASLIAQSGFEREIVVVDDASMDATRTIAEGFSGVRVVAARPLIPGYSGKCNAAQTGADIARGEWLLFTDADTVHEPGSLAQAVAEGENYQVALLSYSPRQVVRGFWERAVMPVVFAELASRFRSADVCDPASPAAAANGQYLLIRREAYQAAGGHDAVAHTLLEDVELARRVKQSGRKIRFRYGGEMVSTRMYRSFRELREGWTKNLALLFPNAHRLALWRFAEFVSGLAGVVTAVAGLATGHFVVATGGLAVAVVIWTRFAVRIRKAHFGLLENCLAPFGLPVFAGLLLRSWHGHRAGGCVTWKGRSYSGEAAQPARPASGAQEAAVPRA
ncbi:MAG: glycosyltransferase family 2 protein [Candidatus Korobacteraceae bacterium]